MEYKGTWSAATNTPTLANGTGDTGDVYICNAAGSVNFGAGAISFAVGDYVIYSGTIWQRSSGAVGTVTSVALTVGGDAISVSGSPLTTSGTLGLTFNGTTAQYIRGNGTLETFPSLTGFVPYTGATANLDLGTHTLIAAKGTFSSSGSSDTVGITHSSGSGIALNITKGGNGEGLYINKTSGSGNAATIIGTLNATTLVKSGGTSSQFLKADGSVDTNTYYLASNPNAYITLASLSAGAGISYNNTTGVIASTITQYTDALARAAISLTTTGTSGAATYNSTTGVLNVPQYAPDLSGYVPTSRTLTINGTAYDLSANRSWSVGTVTSVGLSSATSGVTIGSTPITTSGTITLAIATASGSQQGLLSSTDWTTFNNKQSALTNPVTGTGTTNYLPKFKGTSTIGNSLVYDNDSVVSIGTNGTLVQTLNINSTYASQSLNSTSGNFAYIGLNNGATGGAFNLAVEGSTGGTFGTGSTAYAGVLSRLGAYNLQFATNNVVRATLDASGNLGLGVTPSAWQSDFKAIQLQDANIFSYSGNAGLQFTTNAYYSSGFKYQRTAGATYYVMAPDSHQWHNAPSGTAGNAISFTQRMTLDASGNLMVGGTSVYGATITSYGSATRSGGIGIRNSAGTVAGFFGTYAAGSGSGSTDILAESAGFMAFASGGSERLRITSGGLVGIGTAIPSYTFHTVSSNSTIGAFRNNGAAIGQLLIGNTIADLALRILASGDSFIFSDTSKYLAFGSNGGSERMRILSGGNVGIGTTSPAYLLDVNGTGRFSGGAALSTAIFSNTGNDGGIDVINTGTLAFGRTSQLRLANGTTYFGANDRSYQLVNIGMSSTAADFYIQYYNGTSYFDRFRIASTGAATFSSSVTATSFYVPNGGDFGWGDGTTYIDGDASNQYIRAIINNSEKLRINSSGNVGIGTTSPNSLLEVNRTITFSSVDTYAQLVVKTTSGANGKLLNIGVDEANSVSFIQSLNRGTDAMPLSLQRYGGAVLIGTTTEGALGKLQVAGSVAITGQYNTVLPSSSFSYFDGSGQVVSSASSASALYLDTTWNTTGNPDGIYLNVTNTASGASSKLLNLKVGSVSQFSVSKAGAIQTTAPSSGSAQPWKLGSYAAGGTGTATGVIYIEINGQIYSIPALQGTP